jgi:hypothetical protein
MECCEAYEREIKKKKKKESDFEITMKKLKNQIR